MQKQFKRICMLARIPECGCRLLDFLTEIGKEGSAFELSLDDFDTWILELGRAKAYCRKWVRAALQLLAQTGIIDLVRKYGPRDYKICLNSPLKVLNLLQPQPPKPPRPKRAYTEAEAQAIRARLELAEATDAADAILIAQGISMDLPILTDLVRRYGYPAIRAACALYRHRHLQPDKPCRNPIGFIREAIAKRWIYERSNQPIVGAMA